MNLTGWFSGFHFLICPTAQDLYFWGIRRTTHDDFSTSEDFRTHVLNIDRELWTSIGAVTISHYTDAVGHIPRGVVPGRG